MRQNNPFRDEDPNVVFDDEGAPKVLKTYDRHGRLVFQLATTSESSVLYFPGLDLEIRSDENGIGIMSERPIRISSPHGVSLRSGETEIVARPKQMVISADQLTTEFNTAQLQGKKVDLTLESLRLTCLKLERFANRVLEYAQEAYQRVETLWHVRAGRVRSETSGTHLIQAQAVRVQATEDVRVQGESINLG